MIHGVPRTAALLLVATLSACGGSGTSTSTGDTGSAVASAEADPVAGKVAVTWQAVEGEQTDAVQYRFKEGSSPFWVGLQVRNHRLPITQLETRPDGTGPWIALPRTDYNYFVDTQGVSGSSVEVRITQVPARS